MNKRLSISLEVISFSLGIWLFISNTLDSGSDECIVAGLGAGLVLLGLFMKELRLKLSIARLSKISKIIVFVSGVIGTWIFVTNTLDSGSDEIIFAGFGGALMFISIYIKEFNKEQPQEHNITKELNIKMALLFVVAFTVFGLLKKDNTSLNYYVQDIETDVNDLEMKIDNVESYSHYH